eukprot:6306338-Prymnesium_polylepis.1
MIPASVTPGGMNAISHAGPCSPAGDHRAKPGIAGAVNAAGGGAAGAAPDPVAVRRAWISRGLCDDIVVR